MTTYEFQDALRTYCTLLGGSVTSYGRTAAHNAKEEGVAHSGHLVWRAADVTYDVTPPLPERQNWARRLGLRVIPEEDHDHLQPATWEAG